MDSVEDLVTKVMASLTIETGKWVIDRLKLLRNLNIVKAAATLKANPDNDEAKKKLLEELKKEIEESPSLAQDLSNVLSQSVTIKESSYSTVTQVQGRHNRA